MAHKCDHDEDECPGLTEAEVKEIVELCLAGVETGGGAEVDHGHDDPTRDELITILNGYVPDHAHPLDTAAIKLEIQSCLAGTNSPITQEYLINILNLGGGGGTVDPVVTEAIAKDIAAQCIIDDVDNAFLLNVLGDLGGTDGLSAIEVKALIVSCINGTNGNTSPITQTFLTDILGDVGGDTIDTRYSEKTFRYEDALTGIGDVDVLASTVEDNETFRFHKAGVIDCVTINLREFENIDGTADPAIMNAGGHGGGTWDLRLNPANTTVSSIVYSAALPANFSIISFDNLNIPFAAGDSLFLNLRDTPGPAMDDPRIVVGYTQELI